MSHPTPANPPAPAAEERQTPELAEFRAWWLQETGHPADHTLCRGVESSWSEAAWLEAAKRYGRRTPASGGSAPADDSWRWWSVNGPPDAVAGAPAPPPRQDADGNDEWEPVGELPKAYRTVRLKLRSGGIVEGWWDVTGWFDADGPVQGVTHWAHKLPLPPGGAAGAEGGAK
jgi:hypothetical protein